MKSTKECIVDNIYYVETDRQWYIFKAKSNLSSCTAIKGRVGTEDGKLGHDFIMSPSPEDRVVREAHWDEKAWYSACVSEGMWCPKPISVNNYEIF